MESDSSKLVLRRLRELRERHELTQEQFSEISGISYKYYQAIEQGHRPDLRISTLERIAKCYGLQVYELLSPKLPATKIQNNILSKRPKGKSNS